MQSCYIHLQTPEIIGIYFIHNASFKKGGMLERCSHLTCEDVCY